MCMNVYLVHDIACAHANTYSANTQYTHTQTDLSQARDDENDEVDDGHEVDALKVVLGNTPVLQVCHSDQILQKEIVQWTYSCGSCCTLYVTDLARI